MKRYYQIFVFIVLFIWGIISTALVFGEPIDDTSLAMYLILKLLGIISLVCCLYATKTAKDKGFLPKLKDIEE